MVLFEVIIHFQYTIAAKKNVVMTEDKDKWPVLTTFFLTAIAAITAKMKIAKIKLFPWNFLENITTLKFNDLILIFFMFFRLRFQ